MEERKGAFMLKTFLNAIARPMTHAVVTKATTQEVMEGSDPRPLRGGRWNIKQNTTTGVNRSLIG